MHSKLRNGGAKGRASRLSSTTATATPSTPTTTATGSSGNSNSNASSNGTNSATAGLPTLAPSASVLNSIANMAKQAQLEAKRKLSSDDPGSNSNDGMASSGGVGSGSSSSGGAGAGATTVATVVNPVTGLNVQILPKKVKTTSPCAISPVLLECPEQFCSKKYKHANGLRYHQSHAHGGGSGGGLSGSLGGSGHDEDSQMQIDVADVKQEGTTTAAGGELHENNRSSSPNNNSSSSRGATTEVATTTTTTAASVVVKEEKDAEKGMSKVTAMDTSDSRSNSSSLNLSATPTTTPALAAGGVLRFGPVGSTTDEAMDDATMDSQKSGTGGESSATGRESGSGSGPAFKHKKGRKSPGPTSDGTSSSGQLMGALSAGGGPQSNRAEDVKSPAYSDISDDSTPVAEAEANRKW